MEVGCDSEYSGSDYNDDGSDYYSDNDNNNDYSASNVVLPIAIDNNKTSALKIKFTGECKKDLQGVVIVWNSNIPKMTKQYSDFNRCVITVAGKTSSYMVGVSIEQQEKLDIMSFAPEERDESLWTNNDGTINKIKKDYADGMASYEMKQISGTFGKYKTDWVTMFPWILGQICPETLAHLFRFKDWLSIADEKDHGKLMKLL